MSAGWVCAKCKVANMASFCWMCGEGKPTAAMTTVAPPEKMTNEGDLPCPVCSGTPYDCGHGMVACYDKKDCPINEVRIPRARWQAARRLSGPAGDAGQWEYWDNGHEEGVKGIPAEFKSHPEDELEADLSALVKAHNAALSAPAPAAPRVGDDVRETVARAICSAAGDDPDSPSEPGPNPGPSWEMYVDEADAAIAALSAPPAASADEREELQAILHKLASKTIGEEITNRPEVTLRRWTKKILAAGYRKLAPAHSVGQSAAQGVALPKVWGVSRMADNEQAVLVSFRRPPTDDELRALHDHLRRLSALPKGQEHEG